jgi:hypothetical protein
VVPPRTPGRRRSRIGVQSAAVSDLLVALLPERGLLLRAKYLIALPLRRRSPLMERKLDVGCERRYGHLSRTP